MASSTRGASARRAVSSSCQGQAHQPRTDGRAGQRAPNLYGEKPWRFRGVSAQVRALGLYDHAKALLLDLDTMVTGAKRSGAGHPAPAAY